MAEVLKHYCAASGKISSIEAGRHINNIIEFMFLSSKINVNVHELDVKRNQY